MAALPAAFVAQALWDPASTITRGTVTAWEALTPRGLLDRLTAAGYDAGSVPRLIDEPHIRLRRLFLSLHLDQMPLKDDSLRRLLGEVARASRTCRRSDS